MIRYGFMEILTNLFHDGVSGGHQKEAGLPVVKSVLKDTPTCWYSLSCVPVGILENIRIKCFNFLWKGNRVEDTIPFVKWQRLARPKQLGC